MSNKEVTSAGAVELEESKLDQVAGGAADMFLKSSDASAEPTYETSLKIKFTDVM